MTLSLDLATVYPQVLEYRKAMAHRAYRFVENNEWDLCRIAATLSPDK